MLEQERLDTLACFANIERCCLPSANQISNGFVDSVGNPDEIQFARSK